jgi:hypothetical protein
LSKGDDAVVSWENAVENATVPHCQVDEGGLLSFNLALLDGGRMIGTR